MPSRGKHGEGHGSGEDPESAAVRDCPAYGAWNVQKVATGNWGGPPRPRSIAVSVEERCLITGEEPGGGWGVGRESEAVVVPVEPRDSTTRAGREGPLLRSRACWELLTGECRYYG